MAGKGVDGCGAGGGRGEEDDKPGAVVCLRGASGDGAAGREPRRLLPPRAQRAGKETRKAINLPP